MQWYWVDLAIIGIIVLSVITGLVRGFIKELVALGTWVVAIWVAYRYSQTIDPWLQQYISDKSVRSIAAFALFLIGTVIAGGIVNALLSFILKRTGLSGTDRFLGMGFGFVRGVFFVALIMTAVNLTSLPHEEYAKNSRLYAQFDPVVNWLTGLMPRVISQAKLLDDKKNSIDLSSREENAAPSSLVLLSP